TTSANLSGEAPPVSAEKLSIKIAQHVDFILDSGTCRYQIPSTIVQLNSTLDTYRIIRTGAFPAKEFDEIFRNYPN
ncbi:MAG: Sua5/YciO/YrdC/YwlC family protein, partial [Calditrichaeota bacterium]|nr:Sua5/YciO/YrdC/YwlC family protein [Calditrichota bacterium]